ncbi:hypothetical protein N8881_10610 [Pseudomonadales bacterium]|jgi:sulfide dehydrogenase cytochrome subunit|nr:hypothetical protein [Gammaproteobacteria bacterium]MDA7727225.1 hypothetical protein [Pseudomonadales bacterium]MBT3736371.1 hypothetical protein [Gammaproteobacteria bacterium]MBT7540325.1 hypothetical protein [Gammaproteobacteria bacterium]MDA8880201.1 hypothetical protein [Pseudomonadales bacterium]|tara:strand:- start:9240 stop:9596 length:357 start_codon:yes stop_codon:yes gene_type:complete
MTVSCRKTTVPMLAPVLLVLLGGCAVSAPNIDPGEISAELNNSALTQAASLASVCSGCHGFDAKKQGIVSLKGYSAKRLSILFRGYKNDSDSRTAMHRMARGYTDEQIEQISMYLADR